eukprot:Hpha_TRINITY_DN2459_c0_g1::TRINITY_DN2459_c0_g1_i1::g.24712::m.24712
MSPMGLVRRTQPLHYSMMTIMMIEKMNAFYLKNWDKEQMFDISQRVISRRNKQWDSKFGRRRWGLGKSWKISLTQTPFHKSQDAQTPGDMMMSTSKKKWFWVDPPADMYREQDLPGWDHEHAMAWDEFYKELERAAYVEPEQVFTLLQDLHLEGWTVPAEAYERADKYLIASRERRVLGIKPPITFRTVPRRERWQGTRKKPFDEEWEPILDDDELTQSYPHRMYKPVEERDFVHDPADWADGPLPYPTWTRMEHRMKNNIQARRVDVEKDKDMRFDQMLDQQNAEMWERWQEDPRSFAGDPSGARWMQDEDGSKITRPGSDVPLLVHTDIDFFIEKFYPGSNLAECLALWKYTQDHIMLRHFVFYKTGKTLLEYSEPERFAIVLALLENLKMLLFESEVGKRLPHCWTDQDYIDLVGIDNYQQFLRIEGRRLDEERRKYLRLWSTEVAQEERLDQVVELTKLKYEDDVYKYGGVYGNAARIRDRLDRKKWTIREPSRQVQEHERWVAASRDQRRDELRQERERLTEEAEAAYGNEILGMRDGSDHFRKLPQQMDAMGKPVDGVTDRGWDDLRKGRAKGSSDGSGPDKNTVKV